MSRESVGSDSLSFKIIWRIGDGKSNMNKKMDTLNSTIETLQSQVTGLRSVVRQQSEQIATLTKPQSA
jgi:uncharacterized protein YoxC